MHPAAFIPLAAALIAATVAGGLLASDPKERVSQLAAGTLIASAFWSLCEVVGSASRDASVAVWLMRASALGWMWLGPLCLHLFVEIVGEAHSRLRRLVPWAYAATVGFLALYLTPWCVASAFPTGWGWGARFGPLFPLAFAPTPILVGTVLVQWHRIPPRALSARERRQARWLYAGIAAPLAIGSLTDVLLPYLGLQGPRLGSASVVLLGSVVAGSIRRHGYLLLAPGAFAREILETLGDGVALIAPDGRIRSCNRELARLSGRSPQELLGADARELLPRLPLDAARELRDLELEIRGPKGPRPVSVAVSPLRDARGGAIGSVLAVRDLGEVVSLRSRLVTSSRLAAIGELAAGIAHEINNPISFVRANLLQVRQHWDSLAAEAEKCGVGAQLEPLLGEGEELIEESVEGVDRIAAVVRDVRAFSHAGLGHFESADVNALLENAANVAALRYSVTIERCYAEVPPVHCAPHQLRQVFLNLLFNALRAVDERGRIRLVTQARRGGVEIRVQDDGCGIPESDLERIFDPFFTTRPAGEGTGLGLALCYQIVRSHGGEIHADSQPGRGTTFRILLPAG